MKIYLVRHILGNFLRIKHDHLVSWGETPSVFSSFKKANQAGHFAFNYDDGCHELYRVLEYDLSNVGYTILDGVEE